MADVREPERWPNHYSSVFLDLLATNHLDHVVRRGVDDDDDHQVDHFESFRVAHYSLRYRAATLIVRELRARLATGDLDHEHRSNSLYDASAFVGSPRSADNYASISTARNPHGLGGVYREPQATAAEREAARLLRVAAWQAELAAVLAAAATLAADVTASAASDVAFDTQYSTSFAAGIASDFAAARATYQAELAAKYPDRGFT